MTTSTHALHRARKPRARQPQAEALMPDLPQQRAVTPAREALDFYPTTDADCIRGLLARDGARIAQLEGHVWEPAVGDGAFAREMQAAGLRVDGADIMDRGWPGTVVRDFFAFEESPAPVIITNPPYNRISARDGHGAWLRHTLSMPGWTYCAYLLNWDWPAARANGLGDLLAAGAFTRCYLLRWKVDFTGKGSPPQRNAWFVWDRADPRGFGPGMTPPSFCVMDREDGDKLRQGAML